MSSDKSSSLNRQISELEEKIKQRRATSSQHFEELKNTVSESITASKHSFREKLSAPETLFTAFGIGFILDRMGILRSPEIKNEKDLEKARRKAVRQQQKKAESKSIFKRLQTTVTLITATAAVFSRLDDYVDKINKKTAEQARAETAGEKKQASGHAAKSPTPAVSPDNSGQLRP